MSETLASALLAAQKAMPAIHKDSRADTGKFSYTYLSLQRLLEVVLPVLNEAGLALSQMPSIGPENQQALTTTLLHGATGEKLVAETPLILGAGVTPQAWGGAVTYARRYALTALLGIAADEDDDAAAASKPQARQGSGAETQAQGGRSAARPTQASSAAPGNTVPATAPQTGRVHALISDLAKSRNAERSQVQEALKATLGIESMSNLSAENATKAVEVLLGWQKKVEATA